eukprot:767566-Hanusia_phi.AAC.4
MSGDRQLEEVQGCRRVQYEPIKSGKRAIGVLELRMSRCSGRASRRILRLYRAMEGESDKEALQVFIQMLANALERLNVTATSCM